MWIEVTQKKNNGDNIWIWLGSFEYISDLIIFTFQHLNEILFIKDHYLTGLATFSMFEYEYFRTLFKALMSAEFLIIPLIN